MPLRTLLLAGMVFCRVGPAAGAGQAPSRMRVSAWFPCFTQFDRGYRSLQKHAGRLSELLPYWYSLEESATPGVIDEYDSSGGDATGRRVAEADRLVRPICAEHGILLIPVVGASVPQRPAIEAVLHDPAIRTEHIRILVNLAVSNRYDGLDINYETLKPADRDDHTRFITDLAAAMHAKGKLLTLTTFNKASDTGGWEGNAAHDWPALARVVDRLRVMNYDEQDNDDPVASGPVSTFFQFAAVLKYAASIGITGKIQMGLTSGGMDWAGGRRAIGLEGWQVRALLARTKARPEYDPVSGATWFTYRDRGASHRVCFEDHRPLPEKIRSVRNAGADGIILWHLGSESDAWWTALDESTVRTPLTITPR